MKFIPRGVKHLSNSLRTVQLKKVQELHVIGSIEMGPIIGTLLKGFRTLCDKQHQFDSRSLVFFKSAFMNHMLLLNTEMISCSLFLLFPVYIGRSKKGAKADFLS